jgi:hypothetical protein
MLGYAGRVISMARLTEAVPIRARLSAAFGAGVVGFAVANCLLLVDATSHGYPLMEGWSMLALFVAVPAAAVALMPFSGRLFCFGLGLIAVLGTSFMDVSGADNGMAIVPFAAICLAVASAVAEVSLRIPLRLVRPKVTGS